MDGERGLFTGGDDEGGGEDEAILFVGNNDGGRACAGWYWDGSCVVLNKTNKRKYRLENWLIKCLK